MKIISPETDEDFEKYFELRWRILRKPWNQPLGSERDDDEDISFHLMAIEKNKAIGVARLQFINETTAQLRYMAVDKDAEGHGTGRSIIEAMETYARNHNVSTIMLHARENAVEFYKKTGFKTEEKSYLLFDCIQHYKMTKTI
ncbi:MAG: GNAT family N-acetyltransferase [Gammaproteobacteria bacterium]|nr:GNAT family N-acetyltransferase [Gammaproteobacteria bacterium]MCW9005536.1 GNAT family N-acetyltransferase [Gammaproteobacteria bacterium]